LLLIGTIFQTAKILPREQWVDCSVRINQLLELVDSPKFREQLKIANAYDPKANESESEEEAESPAPVQEKLGKKAVAARADFEVERSVFPALSSFLEKLDDQIYKSY